MERSLVLGVIMMKFSRSRWLLTTAIFAVAVSSAASAQEQTYQFNIPAEPLGQALTDFSQVSSKPIFLSEDVVKGRVTKGLHGQYTASQALDLLLAGTDLKVATNSAGVLMVQSKNVQAASNEAAERVTPVETVVVTGTHIAGAAPVGSDVHLYSREAIDQSGASTLDQFARQLPENLSSVDSVANLFSGAQHAGLPAGDASPMNGASFNLNGLGVSSTLTLLNGNRLAPAGGAGGSVDISMIPLSAIDHIEVLSDGASAIYGSDAVAGVVNIITRKDFDGLESQVRYGGATSGGADEFVGSQAVGHSWGTGNVLLNYEYDQQAGLDASKRSYIPGQGGPTSLVPKNIRNSVFLTGNQLLGENTTISGEALYTDRNTWSEGTTSNPAYLLTQIQSGNEKEFQSNVAVDHSFGGDWQASINGGYSTTEQNLKSVTTTSYSGTTTLNEPTRTYEWSVDGQVSGTVASLPGGDVKIAVGGAYRDEGFGYHYSNATATGTAFSYPAPLSRQVGSVFGELLVPVVGPQNSVPLVQKLEISAAVRYDRYSDFGSTTNPKVGLNWQLSDELTMRGTYGTSFRAPLLFQSGGRSAIILILCPTPRRLPGTTDTLLESGGNSSLTAENATVFTAGVDYAPEVVPGLRMSAGYTNTDYSNRIGLLPITSLSQYFGQAIFAPYITPNPSATVVQAAFLNPGFEGDFAGKGVAGVTAIFDARNANAAIVQQQVLNLRLDYSLPTVVGTFNFAGAVNSMLEDSYQAVKGYSATSLVNSYGDPLAWRGRGTVGWTDNGFTATATVNYTGAYRDTLVSPVTGIAPWVTTDFYVSYSTGKRYSTDYLDGLKIALAIQNVADADPPFVKIPAGQNNIPFDPVNASPLGRLISLQLTKSW